jgi:hypothetical protein
MWKVCREGRPVSSKAYVEGDEIDKLTICASHCPWVDNCIGVNNHKHFLLYVVFMIIGIAILVQLTIDCKSFACLNKILC